MDVFYPELFKLIQKYIVKAELGRIKKQTKRKVNKVYNSTIVT